MFRKMKWFVAMLLVLGICTDAALAELIGYWPFDEGQGTEASDITGNGNDGTFNGNIEWVPGYKGSAGLLMALLSSGFGRLRQPVISCFEPIIVEGARVCGGVTGFSPPMRMSGLT
jgi:hypothetical protein